jgi:hypothetical protein
VPLEQARAELEPLEAVEREVRDLTALLRARLSPEQFRLVWALRDAVERLGMADARWQHQRFVDDLARHLPDSAAVLHAVSQHLCAESTPVDDPV